MNALPLYEDPWFIMLALSVPLFLFLAYRAHRKEIRRRDVRRTEA